MKHEILATIAQGTLKGTEEEGMMTFYRKLWYGQLCDLLNRRIGKQKGK